MTHKPLIFTVFGLMLTGASATMAVASEETVIALPDGDTVHIRTDSYGSQSRLYSGGGQTYGDNRHDYLIDRYTTAPGGGGRVIWHSGTWFGGPGGSGFDPDGHRLDMDRR